MQLQLHVLTDESLLYAAAGQRVSGSVSYHYLTMTFSAPRLPAALHKNNCPSLESIINQAYSAGVGPHDNDLMAKFAEEAAGQHRTPTNLVGQAVVAPELAQMSPFGRRLQQLGRWLPTIRVVPPSGPPSPPSPPPAPPAAAPTPSPPAQEAKPAESSAPSSDSKQAGDSKAPAEAPATKPADATAEKPAEKPAEQPADKPTEQPAENMEQQQPAEKPTEQQPAPAEQKATESPKAEAVSSPAADQVAAPVAVEPPTTDQLVGPHKTAEEPASAAAPVAADKPAANAPKAAPAAETSKPDADKTPAPALEEPQPAEEPKSGSGTIPIPPETDDSGSSSNSAAAPAEQPAPAVAPTVQPAPAALGPAVPAPQPADPIHQQLAANNGYLVDPAASAGQAWGAFPGGNAVHYGAGGYPVGMYGDAPPQVKVTFMFGFSHNKTFAYGRGRVVSAPAGSIKYTIEAQNW